MYYLLFWSCKALFKEIYKNSIINIVHFSCLFNSWLIQEVLAQTREKEAQSMTEVTWRGRSIPVKNEKVRAFILHAQHIARELDSAEDIEGKMSMYEDLLMECKDALQAVKDELKGDTVSHKSLPFSWKYLT